MQITGIIEKILSIQTGEGKNGAWVKQEVLINQGGKYPKSVCITFIGTKCTPEGYSEGDNVEIEANAESREWQGKYFTSINAWKIQKVKQEDDSHKTERIFPKTPAPEPIVEQETDDIPF